MQMNQHKMSTNKIDAVFLILIFKCLSYSASTYALAPCLSLDDKFFKVMWNMMLEWLW